MASASKAVSKPVTERNVIIAGEVCLYNAKAPYEQSGKSILGGLEFDPDDDTVRCHECGMWFKSLGCHIRTHGLTGRQYKQKHGLRLSTALVSEGTRKELAIRMLNSMANPKRMEASLSNPTFLANCLRANNNRRSGVKNGYSIVENQNANRCAGTKS